mmetsp:Transcript_24810/g.83201  ORF Transcript_24810/g.83201 Transcript_24810/m.83201 type:complete len:131 (-) Transcript_24810:199-591(-)|eukprot:CAMPEP_0206013508 /NCGR_PEP_ID=MMETSP1464-20131121/16599_1 /ASSEMBLY_ACC=CAM_ASM_001124 /TAXON_ID=119497 /ORGANISM="Exanthemachrysis gayraliae, Strain RCC1523" /LENGTH=130 /DNA_ID=CAMNT_0053387227 /DNA_START=77 /DNA_END=469 /DNA_ORIENTATION=-
MNLTQLITLSFLAVCSIFLHIFACAIYDNWWPMLVLLGYISLPVPMLMFAILRGSSGDRNGLHWAEFATSFFFVHVLGIPFLLHHLDKIGGGALVMSLFGTAFAVAAVVVHVLFSGSAQDIYNALMGEGF